MKQLFIFIIRIYQWTISPVIGPVCRFTPTCSHYAVEALQKHGALKGSWMTLKRIGRCCGCFDGGRDEVP